MCAVKRAGVVLSGASLCSGGEFDSTATAGKPSSAVVLLGVSRSNTKGQWIARLSDRPLGPSPASTPLLPSSVDSGGPSPALGLPSKPLWLGAYSDPQRAAWAYDVAVKLMGLESTHPTNFAVYAPPADVARSVRRLSMHCVLEC